MPDQIVLEWAIDTTGAPVGPTEAETALAAVPLYTELESDPVLGQLFGLTVESDVTVIAGPVVTRTLTLNMTNAGVIAAPPFFACRPRPQADAEEIEPPYLFRESKTLPGSFFVENGLAVVQTTASQIPSLAVGDLIQFLSQETVYEIAIVTPTTITLTDPYTGVTTNTTAFKEVPAPVELERLAVFSTSDLDTNGIATIPAIPAGAGARSVEIKYLDSTGAGPFEAEADLTGKRPAGFVFDAPPGIDVAAITEVIIQNYGGFENSLGQITIVGLSDALPAIPTNATPEEFVTLTDEAQLLIDRALVYMPPSYHALAGQGAATPQLSGDFLVTTGSRSVTTTEDQTGALAAGNTVRFAFQPNAVYTVAAVTPRILTLVEEFSGVDIGPPPNSKMPADGQPAVKGTTVNNRASGAYLVDPSPAGPPTNAQLAAPLSQQSLTGSVAMPPPNPPFPPATVPAPTFLSDLFTQTIQLALRGVTVTPATIAFV